MRYDQWLQLRLGLLACYSGQPSWFSPSRISPDYSSVWLIHQGSAHIQFSKGELTVHAGEGVLLPSGPRKQSFTEDVQFHSISFFANWPDGSSLFPQQTPLVFVAGVEKMIPILDDIQERFVRSVSAHSFFSFREQVSLETFLDLQQQVPYFLKTLIQIMESDGHQIRENRELDERVRQAIDFMERYDWQNGPLRLRDLGKNCGVSASHLDRLFRLELDTSPMKWMNRLRKQKARRILQTGRLPVKQIAYEMGFGSLSHFSRWYREQTGHPPGQEKKEIGSGTF